MLRELADSQIIVVNARISRAAAVAPTHENTYDDEVLRRIDGSSAACTTGSVVIADGRQQGGRRVKERFEARHPRLPSLRFQLPSDVRRIVSDGELQRANTWNQP